MAVRAAAGAVRETVQTTAGASGDDPEARRRWRTPLGIPTIRDRVVQTASKLVLEPVLEADLSPYTFGYRPKKSALDAIKVVQGALNQGYADVVDADLSKYFDTIPHDELLKSVAARIADRNILRLIKMWLKAPVEERTEDGGKRMSGGKNAKMGTPHCAQVARRAVARR